MANVAMHCDSTRIELEKWQLHHELVFPAEAINMANREVASLWFSNPDLMKATNILFQVGAELPDEEQLSIVPNASLFFWFRFKPVSASTDASKIVNVHSFNYTLKDNNINKERSHSSSLGGFRPRMKHLMKVTFALTGEVHFRIQFDIRRGVVKSPGAVTLSTRAPSEGGRARIHSVMQEVLAGELFPDVRLTLRDGALPAHRAVLAASSAVFKAMFQHDLQERREGVVNIPDVLTEVMRAALAFVYGEDLPQDNPLLCTELLAVAERYQLLALKEACQDVLCGDSALDALELLLLADTHQAGRLKAAMMQRIASNPRRKDLIDTSVVKKISESHPQILAELLQAIP